MANPYAAPEADLTHAATSDEGVSGGTMEALRGTRKWVRLVGIVALVVAFITALAGVGFVVVAGFSMAGSTGLGYTSGGALIAGIIYVLVALFYGALGSYLVKYASAIVRLLNDGKMSSLESALQQQQKFWRVAGSATMVMLLLMVLGIGAAVILPILTR